MESWRHVLSLDVLASSGSAFQKLQLNQTELTKNGKKSVLRIIEILGGTWGQIDLERKYECAEKALYHCVQKQDESNDSYLARADILWTEVLTKGIKLEELQAYISLMGSGLSPEDKKRVVLESHSSGNSALNLKKVAEAMVEALTLSAPAPWHHDTPRHVDVQFVRFFGIE